jgi:hypothetical protein
MQDQGQMGRAERWLGQQSWVVLMHPSHSVDIDNTGGYLNFVDA